jgi:tripartite-type tricarboxylate transporter receptor subunit TctC
MFRTTLKRKLALSLSLGAAVSSLGAASGAQAQAYPDRPIRLVVPFAPGGSSEIIARAYAQKMGDSMGQQMIVDNRPGGAGNIAMEAVAKAEPDGYTLILGHVGTLAMNPAMFRKLPYDAKDFVPVSLFGIVANVFVVNPSVPANNLKEFVALAKEKPGAMYYGSAGNGSAGHLAFEYLKMVAKINVVHVPYKGTGPQLTDLIGGQTQASSAGLGPFLQHIKAGKLRPIAVGTPKRLPMLPDVATVAEMYPGFETSQWYGLIAPAKVPKPIIDKLAAEAHKAAQARDLIERFAPDGTVAVGGTPAEFDAYIKKEAARWADVVKQSGVKAD